jgi:hypothetical protein
MEHIPDNLSYEELKAKRNKWKDARDKSKAKSDYTYADSHYKEYARLIKKMFHTD